MTLDLIIYLVTFTLLGLSVATAVKILVNQQDMGANQLQQKSSVLQAMNRASSDINTSAPILYATPTELVTENSIKVEGEDAKIIHTRYVLGRAPGAAASAPYDTLYAQEDWGPGDNGVTPGQDYDNTAAAVQSKWGNPAAGQAIVRNLKTPVTVIFQYFDRNGKELTATPYINAGTDVIARVDTKITANLDKAGYVQLASSATPRSALPVDASAANLQPLACPPVSAARTEDGNNVVIRWNSVAGAVKYEVMRDNSLRTSVNSVANQQDYFYQDELLADGVPHQYQVVPIREGEARPNCNPVNVTSEIPATLLAGNLIPPTNGSNPWSSTSWNNAAQETVMRLTWSEVPGATRYTLNRQPVADNGSLGTKIEEKVFESGEDLIYDYPAEWDKKWSWSVTVQAASGGSQDSNSIALRGYPAPITPKMTASTYSTNTVDWSSYAPDANVDSYSVYRSKDGAPNGSYDLLATINKGTTAFTSEKYVDNGSAHSFGKPELGSTHTYVVIAHNESGYSNKMKIAQLQFPPDPVLIPVGESGSRDDDKAGVRTNTIKWSAAKSATGYHVERHKAEGGEIASQCLTGSDCTKNSGGVPSNTLEKVDSDPQFVSASTIYDYSAFAYNATGVSPKLGAEVAIVQRPAAPTIKASDTPDLNSNRTTQKVSRNAGTWCLNEGVKPGGKGCSYHVTNYNNSRGAMATLDGNASNDTFNFDNQDWGRHYYYKARSRNGAVTNNGYSDYSAEAAADTYPGPFSVGGGVGNSASRNSSNKGGSEFFYDYVYRTVDAGTQFFPGCGSNRYADCGPHWGQVVATWGGSTGARGIVVDRQRIGGTSQRITSVGSGAGWVDANAEPGLSYRWDLTATSIENGLTRKVSSAQINTMPDVNNASEIMTTCIGYGANEHFKIVQTRYNAGPIRNNWSYGTTMSIWAPSRANNDDTTAYAGSVTQSYRPGQGYSQLAATNFGIKAAPWALGGFRNYVTWDGVGSSMVIENSITQVAPPTGCGAVTGPAADQGNYIEPSGACYGFYPGIDSCVPTIPGNRPQYYSR